MDTPNSRQMHRGHAGKMIAGVCAGLAEQLRLDPVVVRVAFVVGLALSGGLAFAVYVAFWLLTPAHAGGEAPAGKIIEQVSSWFTATPDGQPVRDPPEARER